MMRLFFIAVLLGSISCSEPAKNVDTHVVERGEFVVAHFEGGEVQAATGEVIMSPRIGGRLKITDLAPEGEHVDVGDLIIRFDPAEFQDDMLDREARLQQARSDFEKAKAQRDSA